MLLHTHKDNIRNNNIWYDNSNNNTCLLYRFNHPFFIKIFFFVILLSISYLILILALNPSILGGVWLLLQSHKNNFPTIMK